MNRTKIEEMLKEAKIQQSFKDLSSDDWNYLQSRIETLTSLLAEDGGEEQNWDDIFNEFYWRYDHQISNGAFDGMMLMRFKDWISTNYTPPSQYSPIVKDEAKLSFAQIRDAIQSSKWNIVYQQASIDIVRDIFDSLPPAPSATVDEPKHLSSEQRQKLFDFFLDSFEIHLLEDEFNTIESIIYPRTYPYTLKDPQQPSVDEIVKIEEPKGLHSCPDAKVWADYYCAINPSADNGTMIGWFANAMMAMHDHLYQTNKLHSQRPTVDVKEIAFQHLTEWQKQMTEITEDGILKDGLQKRPLINVIISAIQQALRGSYTREDMIAFGRECMDEDACTSEMLDQYDTERGK